MNEVILADPQNSAPRIYLAIIKSKTDSKQEMQKKLNQIESETTHFNSYILNFTKTLFKQINTPEDLLSAYDLWRVTPIPKYNVIGDFLKLHRLEKVTEQLLADGLSEKKFAEDIDWFTVEYAIGLSVMNKIRPDHKFPAWKEVYNSKRTKYINELGHASNNGVCNMNFLYELVTLLPNYL